MRSGWRTFRDLKSDDLFRAIGAMEAPKDR
jgi:hypothetical protein